jgi:ABC-type glutathione transport system ATPase component
VAETAAPPAVVQLQGVRKAYNVGTPFETEVLHGIDLTVRRGEFCAVVGPSGSGKSTLLNIVGLLDRPTSGTVEVCGEQTAALDDRALTRLRGHGIGFVFQYHHLITAFTALENVMMPMLGAEEFPNEAMRTRAETLIRKRGPDGAGRTTGRASSAAASSSAWPSPGRWPWARRCCWPTSRPATSTPRAPTRCLRCCGDSTPSTAPRCCS